MVVLHIIFWKNARLLHKSEVTQLNRCLESIKGLRCPAIGSYGSLRPDLYLADNSGADDHYGADDTDGVKRLL